MSKLREAVEALLAVRDDYDGSDVRAFLVNNEAAIASLRAALAADDEGDAAIDVCEKHSLTDASAEIAQLLADLHQERDSHEATEVARCAGLQRERDLEAEAKRINERLDCGHRRVDAVEANGGCAFCGWSPRCGYSGDVYRLLREARGQLSIAEREIAALKAKLGATAAASDPLTVEGEFDIAAASLTAARRFNRAVLHDDITAIVTAATRNLRVVKVPTRGELAAAIGGAVYKETGCHLVTRENYAAADAVLRLMGGRDE